MLSLRSLEDVQQRNNQPLKTPSRFAVQHPRTLLKENAASRLNWTGKTPRLFYPATPAPGPSFKPTTILRTGGLNDISNRNAQLSPKTPQQLKFGVTPSKPLDFPGTILRPSSTRRSVRKSRGSIYETPDAQGRRPHWEDISSASPTVSPVQALVNEILEEDDSEVEYVPPRCAEEAWEPDFDMPDYKVLGAAIMAFGRRPTIGEDWHVDLSVIPEPAEEIDDTASRRGAMRIDDEEYLYPARRHLHEPSETKQPAKAPLKPSMKITTSNPLPKTTMSKPPTKAGISKSKPVVTSRPVSSLTKSTVPSRSASRVPSAARQKAPVPMTSKRPVMKEETLELGLSTLDMPLDLELDFTLVL